MVKRNVMMRKLFYSSLVAFFMFSAIGLSAAVQYDSGGGVENVKTKQYVEVGVFSVPQNGPVYLNVKDAGGGFVKLKNTVITNFGFYDFNAAADYLDNGWRIRENDPTKGDAPAPVKYYGDMSTGFLGKFNTRDKFVLWVETQDENGNKHVYTTFDFTGTEGDIWSVTTWDDGSVVFGWGENVNGEKKSDTPYGLQFALSSEPPSGQPLPGIIATLIVGSGAVVYLKKRKKSCAAK